MRSFYILPNYYLLSGELLLLLWGVHPLSALRGTRSFLTQRALRTRVTKQRMIRESCVPVRSTPTRNRSLLALIRWIWTKTRKKCFLKRGRGWLTLGGRRLREKLERSSSRKRGGLLLCRRGESWRRLGLVIVIGKGNGRGLIIMRRFLLRRGRLRGFMILLMKIVLLIRWSFRQPLRILKGEEELMWKHSCADKMLRGTKLLREGMLQQLYCKRIRWMILKLLGRGRS